MAILAAIASEDAAYYGIGAPIDGHGLVADALDLDEELMMDSEASRRQLAAGNYISYGALRRNRVPCSRRGHSYYNCRASGRANPYRRGCTRVTRCARTNR
ncbi:rapid alkalinization factor [Genlisea aurea]|uniref:Rapid alkalinization factor n=1 Tax=Genlisea aurea TaxID=192259 RepID=S8CZN7_9LAMI|nr:rapid alkalinization factor [Genlisea aurea]